MGCDVVRVLLLAAGAAMLLAACDSAAQTARNPEPADSTPPARITVHELKVGQAVTLTGKDDAGHPGRLRIAVKVAQVIATAHGHGVYEVPGRGARFVAVRFILKNVGTALYDDGPDYGASVVDDEGRTYDPIVAAVTAGPGFARLVRLRHGQARSGFIVFAVPSQARIVSVRYALNAGLATDRAEWRVLSPHAATAPRAAGPRPARRPDAVSGGRRG